MIKINQVQMNAQNYFNYEGDNHYNILPKT